MRRPWLLVPGSAGAVPQVDRVSVDSAGGQADDDSYLAAVSASGRFVAFVSSAGNLVAGDTNGLEDVFVRDRLLGRTERVSVSSSGAQATGGAGQPAISANGRFVAFSSAASNLVPGDRTGHSDVFVRDRQRGTTVRVSVGVGGHGANDDSYTPALSADGRSVAFLSAASDLVAGDGNGYTDVFVATASGIRLASVGLGGAAADNHAFAPALSDDGRIVVWSSRATTLVPGNDGALAHVYARDLAGYATSRVSVGVDGEADGESGLNGQAVSADGSVVAFSSDATNIVATDQNGHRDVFVRDLSTGVTTLASVHSDGTQGNVDSSYIHLDLSADGRLVAYASAADNLVDGDTNGYVDSFVYDRIDGRTERVTLNLLDRESARGGVDPVLSADGRLVVFHSLSPNLVPGDTNRSLDVFTRLLD